MTGRAVRPAARTAIVGSLSHQGVRSCRPRSLVVALATLATCAGFCPSASAEDANPPIPNPAPGTTPTPPSAETIVVTGRADSQLGIADSAAQGTVGKSEIDARPLLRVGELMETIPGMIATEHSGGGKANQYFLRGFDLDHGTDFATSIDGAPVNFRSHAHGQGYTDLNFVIPEVIGTLDYRKGPYYAQDGDFGSAGAADLHYVDTLPHGLASLTLGTNSYERAVVADSMKAGDGNVLYAVDGEHYDGPWENPNDFRRINGLLRYSQGDHMNGWSITGSAYAAKWNASDQIPRRAVDSGIIGTYGALDPTDGGKSQRYEVTGNMHVGDATQQTIVSLYALAYRLSLFSNFTFFLDDPINGDQFEQTDRRFVTGGSVAHHWSTALAGKPVENTLGFQVRDDYAPDVGLFHTVERIQTNPSVAGQANGLSPTATVRRDRINESSVGVYGQTDVSWTPWFHSLLGLRADQYHFDVEGDNPLNSGTKSAGIVSPKGSLVFGPWDKTEFYLNGGLGFHSNDARGVVQTVDPSTGAPVSAATPLVRSKGAEIGVRSDAIDNLHSTLGLFLLDLNSELLLSGDSGTTVPTNAATRRLGLEWSNYYKPTSFLSFDGDVSYTYARFREYVDAEGGGQGQHIPGAIPLVMTAGVTSSWTQNIYTSLRLRFFSRRPLNETDTVESTPSATVNARVGYHEGSFEAHIDVLNILNRKDDDQSYYYQSQLRGEAGPVEDVHFHPDEPIGVRGEISYSF